MNYYHQQPVHSQPVYPPPPPSATYYASPAVASHHHQPKTSHDYASHYPRVTSTSLGAAELFMAVISLTGGIMALVHDASMDHVGTGIWCGIFVSYSSTAAQAEEFSGVAFWGGGEGAKIMTSQGVTPKCFVLVN